MSDAYRHVDAATHDAMFPDTADRAENPDEKALREHLAGIAEINRINKPPAPAPVGPPAVPQN